MNAKAGKRGGLCGLDVEAEGDTEEVQKGFTRAADWTLKQREARRKSKTRFPQNKIPSIPLANQH